MIAHTVVAGTAGMGSAAAFGWPTGAVVAAATVPLCMIYVRVRPSPATRWRRGAAAERQTGRELARLDPAGYYVLHDRALPGDRPANLDHLVIGLTGVFAIVSRRWSRRARVWVERQRLLVGGRPVAALLSTTARAADAVSDLLRAEVGFEVPVAGVVAVHGGRLPRTGLVYEDVVFQRADRLPVFVKGHPVVFTSAQVATIAAAAERRLPPMVDQLAE